MPQPSVITRLVRFWERAVYNASTIVLFVSTLPLAHGILLVYGVAIWAQGVFRRVRTSVQIPYFPHFLCVWSWHPSRDGVVAYGIQKGGITHPRTRCKTVLCAGRGNPPGRTRLTYGTGSELSKRARGWRPHCISLTCGRAPSAYSFACLMQQVPGSPRRTVYLRISAAVEASQPRSICFTTYTSTRE